MSAPDSSAFAAGQIRASPSGRVAVELRTLLVTQNPAKGISGGLYVILPIWNRGRYRRTRSGVFPARPDRLLADAAHHWQRMGKSDPPRIGHGSGPTFGLTRAVQRAVQPTRADFVPADIVRPPCRAGHERQTLISAIAAGHAPHFGVKSITSPKTCITARTSSAVFAARFTNTVDGTVRANRTPFGLANLSTAPAGSAGC